ncbi:bifunctional UDP-N-acetylglucosamine diphosphorylase/glucosamine-1-phosphate N-acetyltransferase GlmU [Pectinatus brassicae]|uniref:Bifunctional protein GlmU n=1 Tax=Pectinatus brassicae TaxID=862415 RepID=A0A840UL26_9FIRM|nr:bifunctional UDP-N-acetylglucosamine diphosphorylase/glucosamine-1-phosphate N-acetyltransferase GlmU [Pectinatus brassicae]MBB5334942.1 bifunctional UDP-N-acetylglucosamine pyrophosphorylase/glucosamine-1-phosphate N-acetyltransferase [Pectinatus brassicae]
MNNLSTGEFSTIILAAGKGTRMKSDLPKVLHRVGGKAMVNHVIDAAVAAGAVKNIVVVGFGRDKVAEVVGDAVQVVVQEEQLGTGHAVLQAKKLINDDDTVMVLCGDTPLLTAKMLANFYDMHKSEHAQASVLTAVMPNPTGYGRIIRAFNGDVKRIVEEKDATTAEKAITEVNTGIYCFNGKDLFAALDKVGHDNAQGEYYLPDVLEILQQQGKKIAAMAVKNYEATLGINSRQNLSEAERILHRRKNRQLMAEGVTIMDPATTYIDVDVTVGRDTIIYPSTWIEGQSKIGSNCEIGPCSRFSDTMIGDEAVISFTYAHECEIGAKTTIGPYVHLRPNTKIAAGVHIGNFVEVKNSNVGEGTKLPHLSYIGDSDIGSGVNMGCGTITVNYDGKVKQRTVIEDDAFVGCNSNLIAPVTVGKGSYVGAGSTITQDVPAGELAVGRSRQKNIAKWKDKRN